MDGQKGTAKNLFQGKKRVAWKKARQSSLMTLSRRRWILGYLSTMEPRLHPWPGYRGDFLLGHHKGFLLGLHLHKAHMASKMPRLVAWNKASKMPRLVRRVPRRVA